jgi:spore coat polysaccharide biosynthesis protein SpsF
MKTIAIIQARMNSHRLPGKVLADVCGKPLLWYVIQRTKLARSIDDVIVATPNTPDNAPIHGACAQWKVPSYGPVACEEADVLTRYARLVEELHADRIVRITADCPLIDPDIIDATIGQLHGERFWASNIVPRTWPDGLDVEVLTATALAWMDRNAIDAAHREHVTSLMYADHRPLGTGGAIQCPVPLGDLRWTVDTSDDLDWVRHIYTRVPWQATWSKVLFLGGGLGRRTR